MRPRAYNREGRLGSTVIPTLSSLPMEVTMSKIQNTIAPAEIQLPDAFGGTAEPQPPAHPTHLLHFEPLTAGDAGLDIPCDPNGRVGLDALGDKLRNDYFFARTLIGRLFAAPTVRHVPAMAARVCSRA